MTLTNNQLLDKANEEIAGFTEVHNLIMAAGEEASEMIDVEGLGTSKDFEEFAMDSLKSLLAYSTELSDEERAWFVSNGVRY